ncbi:hypothetical protein ES703_07427 [subsurface metagenome]
MIGCSLGRFFQVTVAGGSYQEGLTAVLQGHPPGMLLSEQEIYGDSSSIRTQTVRPVRATPRMLRLSSTGRTTMQSGRVSSADATPQQLLLLDT